MSGYPELQREILYNASQFVRPGGRLVARENKRGRGTEIGGVIKGERTRVREREVERESGPARAREGRSEDREGERRRVRAESGGERRERYPPMCLQVW